MYGKSERVFMNLVSHNTNSTLIDFQTLQNSACFGN